jgi:hypothetical protein
MTAVPALISSDSDPWSLIWITVTLVLPLPSQLVVRTEKLPEEETVALPHLVPDDRVARPLFASFRQIKHTVCPAVALPVTVPTLAETCKEAEFGLVGLASGTSALVAPFGTVISGEFDKPSWTTLTVVAPGVASTL